MPDISVIIESTADLDDLKKLQKFDQILFRIKYCNQKQGLDSHFDTLVHLEKITLTLLLIDIEVTELLQQ